jgi:MYXO-CTERM domain-containing protein
MSSFLRLFAFMVCVGAASPAFAAEFITYFQPTPIVGQLDKTAWGTAAVGPRDTSNGLEDPTMSKWAYWDGKIIKGPDGKYHLFGSRWDQAGGHAGYPNSVAIHAVSDAVLGPYVDQGICYPDNQGGKGHNVTAIAMSDGRYGIVVSDTRPGDLFIASSLEGPWAFQGHIPINSNGHTTTRLTDNMSIMQRPDGRYMIVPLGGFVMISDTGITGPYKVVTDNIFPQNVAGYPSATREDPVVWFSGGQYHVLVDDYHDRKAMHLTSPDGTTWKYKDLAYDPTTDMIRYTDGTVNHWFKLERVGVYMENGHVAYFTFAAIDVDKTLDLGNDKHGSKIIVVPFDGVKFDAETGIDGGAGGTTGTGGATALGGATATGGTTATGGATATGGVKTGGTVSSGGVTASGGVVASGGSPALGGVIASGGATVSGGVPGSAGVLATGGKVSSGGSFASGGAVASGGATASAGVPGSGGVAALGGATLSSAGTVTSTGGVIATGGTQVSTDGASTGGSIQPSPATDGTAQTAASASGCSCKIDQSDNGNPGAMGLLIAAGLFLLGRRRKRD